MENSFVDREHEWAFLERASLEKRAQHIVVYGRRRVGKSFLTSRFISEKGGLYYLCSKGNEREQLELLSSKLADHFRDEGLRSRPFSKWHQFFEYIAGKSSGKRLFIEFDEFPFLIEANPAVPSIFQKYWDELLSKANIYLILCGSSIGMMESKVLGYRSPLYGRRTGQWKLAPLGFKEVAEFFGRNSTMAHMVEIYAVTGGMPFYLKAFDLEKAALENIMLSVARKGSPLSEEGEVLVREELPEAMTYFSILHAIAGGETRQSDIANRVGVPATTLTRYLSNLQRLNLIERIIPVTEKERSKKALYIISDNFLRFWFRFIYPNRSYIEEENYSKLGEIIGKDLGSHVGRAFEGVCMQFILERRKTDNASFPIIGHWWGAYRDDETGERKAAEIDIVTLDEKSAEILFAECKWSNNVDAVEIVRGLAKKAGFVDWNMGKRKESFAVFAKSFKKRIAEFNGKKVHCFDLGDIEKVLRK